MTKASPASKGGGRFESVGARIGQKLTLLQRAHNACRNAYLEHGNLNQLRMPAGVSAKAWRKCVDHYVIPPEAPFTVRKISDAVGLGVFATQPIPKGRKLLESLRGRNVSPSRKGMSLAGYTEEVKAPPPISKYVEQTGPSTRWVQYQLHGLLSFVNHACPKHANCSSTVDGAEWKALKTKNRDKEGGIKAGDELTISYGPEPEWSRMCIKCKNN